MCPYASVGR